jgi:hypothetical protein
MLLFLTLAIVLPFAFPCRESGCVAMPDGGLVCKNDSAIAMDLYGAGDGRLRERAVEETMETFTCRQVRACNNACARLIGGIFADASRALCVAAHLRRAFHAAGRDGGALWQPHRAAAAAP